MSLDNTAEMPKAVDVEDRPPITEILQRLSEGEDLDTATIIAGAVNLQISALQRLQSRTLLGPVDVQNLFRICRVLLTPPEYRPQYQRQRQN